MVSREDRIRNYTIGDWPRIFYRTVNIEFCGKVYNAINFLDDGYIVSPTKWIYSENLTLIVLEEKLKKISKYDRQFINRVFNRRWEKTEYPIFVRSDWCWVANEQLSQYNFQSVIDPYTAFQELYMWHCNKANPEKPIPHISDKIMAEAKGFDKWSFRKEKCT